MENKEEKIWKSKKDEQIEAQACTINKLIDMIDAKDKKIEELEKEIEMLKRNNVSYPVRQPYYPSPVSPIDWNPLWGSVPMC